MSNRSSLPVRKSHATMFTEPQTVTVNAIGIDLPRVSTGNRTGIFEKISAGIKMTIAHQLAKRSRRSVRFDFTETAADPLLDGVSRQYSMSAYLVIDHPPVGFTPEKVEQNAQALVDWLDSPGNLTKVLNGES